MQNPSLRMGHARPREGQAPRPMRRGDVERYPVRRIFLADSDPPWRQGPLRQRPSNASSAAWSEIGTSSGWSEFESSMADSRFRFEPP